MPSGGRQQELFTTAALLKALGSGREGYSYISKILVILLESLLQDETSENCKTFNTKLGQIQINSSTAGELIREIMKLGRPTEDKFGPDESDDESSEKTHNNDSFGGELDDSLLNELEIFDLFDVPPANQVKILVAVLNRFLGCNCVEEHQENCLKDQTQKFKEKMAVAKERTDEAKAEKEKKKTGGSGGEIFRIGARWDGQTFSVEKRNL